jgi:hypothetical protein
MTAAQAHVTINSIHVLDSSVNTTAEPGSSAEWRMTFIVNGQTAQWANDEVKDDTVYVINRGFLVDLNPHGTISIEVSGFEEDAFSANDILPTLQKTLHPAEDFQMGGTLSFSSPTSPEGTYSIECTIMPVQEPGQQLTVAREFIGVYRAGTEGHGLWCADWKHFSARWKEWSDSGLRLTRLSTFRQGTGVVTFGDSTERMFLGVFAPGHDEHALWVSEWPAFQAKWQELSAKTLRLVDLVPHKDGNKRMFAGVFRAGTDGQALWVSEWPAFEQEWEDLSNKGLRLVSLDTYVEGGKRLFTGVYRAGTDGHALCRGVEWDNFYAKWQELSAKELCLIDIASYQEGKKQLFAGVFRAGGDAHRLTKDTWINFDRDWLNATNHLGLRLASIDTFLDEE